MNKKFLPVIHHRDSDTTLDQAGIAFANGAHGVFLISHHGQEEDLYELAMAIKGRYKGKEVGINLLSKSTSEALDVAIDLGLDMVWTDDAGVSSSRTSKEAIEISERLAKTSIKLFASVAFKYQAVDPDPATAAVNAMRLGFIPTTSGLETGHAPGVAKMESMFQALRGQGASELAVASGMTPENVRDFMPYVSHYLVATGISVGFHHFDPARVAAFAKSLSGEP